MDTRKDFLPIILGSDENAYGTVRLFREAYGIRPLLLCTHRLIPTMDSDLFDLEAIPHFDSDEVFVPELKRVLTEKKKQYKSLLVIACSDYYAHMMAIHYDAFDGMIANRFADASLLQRLDTKDSFYAICEQYGLDYPKTYIAAPENRETAPDHMGFSFPIVVKPENSNAVEYLHCHFEGKKKVYFFRDRAEYNAVIAALNQSGYRGKLILQEFIPGGDDAMRVMNTYSDNEGRVRFQCLGQPVLEEYSPATLGNYAAIISRSDEVLYQKIADFLNAIGYVGFANFDMKYDSRTGRYLLFEINGRPGRSSFFVRAAGHNMMKLLTDTTVDGKPFDGVTRNDAVALWTAVPKGVLMKYVSSPALKQEIDTLWKAGRVERTLFSPEEKSLKRRLRVMRYYLGYFKSYKRYYLNKETLQEAGSAMKVTLIEAPICKGSPTDGSQYAYRSLIEGGVAACFDDTVLSPMEPPVATGESMPNMKDVGEVMAVCRELCARVGGAIRERRLPIVIGGDHSVAIGSLAGAASAVGAENLAVVYIDGHTDINTETTTETGFIHGMPLAAAMGLCDERLTVGNRVNLKGTNTYILGARSIDEEEYPIIASHGVTLYTADAIRAKGIEAVVEELLGAITAPAIHVSFDVDFLDQAVFPSTGYRMPDGLTLADADAILTACFASGRVCSLDVVEYNPLLDTDRRDREKLFSLLKQIARTERKVLS